MSLAVITPPTQEPVSLADVYAQLRFPAAPFVSPDDARLGRLITEARERVETITRRALCQQTLRLTIEDSGLLPASFGYGGYYGGGYRELRRSSWGGHNDWYQRPCAIELQRPPVASVTSLNYYDANNALATIDVSEYRVVLSDFRPRIEFVDGYSGPQIFDRSDAVSVTYVAGYPPDLTDPDAPDYAANVPATIKGAILLMVEHAYDGSTPMDEAALDDRIEAMLATYRLNRF